MEKSLIYKPSAEAVRFLDQRRLPHEKVYVECGSFACMREAILRMKLRGAPLIGVAGAFGLFLWCLENRKKYRDSDIPKFLRDFRKACDEMASTRPTAVNLRWACDRVFRHASSKKFATVGAAVDSIRKLCVEMDREDIAMCEKIGANGAAHFKKKYGSHLRVLTHCNAGSLATCGFGTALGVIVASYRSGILDHAFVDETRPYLQGARITAYELSQDKIPYYLICDNMAGWLMKKGEIDLVVTGADRIAANGDAANKIGTYSLSVLARENGVPMYIAAPYSTFDLGIKTGGEIPIEERPEREVTHVFDVRIAPEGARVKNPSFDVSPHENISGIITELGVIEKPFTRNIKKMMAGLHDG